MSFKLVDRTRALSNTTGTGSITLGVTPTGFQSFGDSLNDGDQTYYTIRHLSNGEWEVGYGTYSAGVLSRDTVLSSSDSGAKVNFTGGDKDVFATAPAKYIQNKNNSGEGAAETRTNQQNDARFAQLTGGDDADFANPPKVNGILITDFGHPLIKKYSADLTAIKKIDATTVKIRAGTVVIIGGELIEFSTDTDCDLDIGSFSSGTDYAVIVKYDATAYCTLDLYNNPAVVPADGLKIGGFHYGLVAPAETVAGGSFSTSGVTSNGGSMEWVQDDVNKIRGINEFSIWDLSWRCKGEQRGMTYDPIVNAWCGIYFMSTNPDANGPSRYNTDVASGTVLPYIPAAWGGDGVLKYSVLRFYEANECVTSFGLRLMTYQEACSFFFGVTEGQSLGGASSTIPATLREPGYTSRIGVEQATGHAWVYGQPNFIGGSGWSGAGRGSFYASSGLTLLGGHRTSAGDSGSRAGLFDLAPWHSGWDFSVRAAGDHVKLVIGAR